MQRTCFAKLTSPAYDYWHSSSSSSINSTTSSALASVCRVDLRRPPKKLSPNPENKGRRNSRVICSWMVLRRRAKLAGALEALEVGLRRAWSANDFGVVAAAGLAAIVDRQDGI